MSVQCDKNGNLSANNGNIIPKIVKHEVPTLTDEQTRDVKEVFELFDYNNREQMKTKELKIAMRALGFEPKREEVKSILTEIGKNTSEYLSLNEFMEIMARKYAEKDVMVEIKKAFDLFDDDNTGFITLRNLKRVCNELGEKFKDEDLQEMIDEADKDNDGAISLEEFAFIMQKTNLY